MDARKLDRALAAGVVAVAVLNTLSALSLPVSERRPAPAIVALWFALLALHAALYWLGDRIRDRFGLTPYVVGQTAMVFTLGVTGALFPVALGLLMALTAELIVLAEARWGSIPITMGAIALFVVAALFNSDLYRATTAGLLLAITGVIAHAVAGLLRRQSGQEPIAASNASAPAASPSTRAGAGVETPSDVDLTPRETEVLRELVSGARSTDIAAKLGISERTVKAHLANIYQKLGVESRSAAVAAAVQRRLV